MLVFNVLKNFIIKTEFISKHFIYIQLNAKKLVFLVTINFFQ